MNMTTSIPHCLLVLLGTSTVATLMVLTCTCLLGKQSAALRHFIWLLALNAPLLALMISGMGVHWNLPILPPNLVAAQSIQQLAGPIAPVVDPAITLTITPNDPSPSPVSGFIRAVEVINPWLLGWLIGFLAYAGTVGYGHLRVGIFLRTQCVPASDSLVLRARAIAHRFGLVRPIRIFTSEPEPIPFCAGVIHPVVVLPASPDGEDSEKTDVYLLHELAHAARHDLLCILSGQLACALCWFSPLAWLAFARLRAESELAADDLVLSAGVDPNRYANHILDLIQANRPMPEIGFALAMARPVGIARRINCLLDDSIPRHAPGRGTFVLLALGGFLALFTTFSVRLVAGEVTSTDPAKSHFAEMLEKAATNNGQASVASDASQADARAQSEAKKMALKNKLANMVVDAIDFDHVDLVKVLEILSKMSKELDPDKQGVNFVLQADRLPDNKPSITLSLRHASLLDILQYATTLSKHRYEIKADGVYVTSTDDDSQLSYSVKSYTVPEKLLKLPQNTEPETMDVKQRLMDFGVAFPAGTSAVYIPQSNKMVVRNTDEQQDLIREVIDALDPSQAKSTHLEAQYLAFYLKFHDATQSERAGDTAGALKLYASCVEQLNSIKSTDPAWEPDIVKYRLRDCEAKIASLQAK